MEYVTLVNLVFSKNAWQMFINGNRSIDDICTSSTILSYAKESSAYE